MQKDYKCLQCGKVFKRKYYYENHIYSTGIPCGHKISNTKNGKVLINTGAAHEDVVISKIGQTDFLKTPDRLRSKKTTDILKYGKDLTINQNVACDMVSEVQKKKNFIKKWCMHGNDPDELSELLSIVTDKKSKKIKNNKSLNIFNTEIHNHINTQIFNTTNEITENINILNNNLNIYNSDKINAFGKENLDILTEDVLDSIIENPNGGIVKLIKIIHFNPNVPENRNVVIKNKKDTYFNVYNGDFWEKQDKDTTIHNLLSTKKDIMDDHFENMIEKKVVSNFMITNYNDFCDILDPYLKDNLDSLITDKLSKKNITKKCENIYKKLYDKIMVVMMNDKEINKVLQRKLDKLELE